MKVAKWGNSLAVRLPADMVARLGLKDGDEINVAEIADGLILKRVLTREQALQNLQKMRGQIKLPTGYKFDREEANRRGGNDKD
jgi:antitoxin MazE